MSTVSIEPSHVMIKERASHNIVVWFHFRNALHHFKNLLRIRGMVQGVFCRIIPKIYPIYPYVLIHDMLFCFSIISLQIVLHNDVMNAVFFITVKGERSPRATSYTSNIESLHVQFCQNIIYPHAYHLGDISFIHSKLHNVFAVRNMMTFPFEK